MDIFNSNAFSNSQLENFSSSIASRRPMMDENPHWSPLTPPESLGSEGSSISGEISSLNSSSSEEDTLPQRSSLPISQHQLGEEHGFSVEATGRDLCQRSQMYFVRKDAFFQVVVDFSACVSDLGQHVVRITPSWDLQRADRDTIIYCCGKHMEEGGDRLERLSMLKVSGVRCSYEADEASQRLSVVVPIESKDPSSPFLIPMKSKCFSTCGSNQKKPYHVITVTLEQLNPWGRSIIGRKMLNMKFSSSPFRDIKNFVQRDETLLSMGKKAGSSPSKRVSVQDSSQVVLVPVQKKHIETVRLFLQTLERSQVEEDSSILESPTHFSNSPVSYFPSPSCNETQSYFSDSGIETSRNELELDLDELLGIDFHSWDSNQSQLAPPQS